MQKMIIGFLTLVTFSSFADSTQFIKKVVKKKNLKSIEEIIPFLSRNLRTNYTLQHTPSSSDPLQNATHSDPRVFLFGLDAKVVITFNGNEEHKGNNTLEVLEFDELNNRFNLFELKFTEDKKLSVDKNPMKCLIMPSIKNNRNDTSHFFQLS